MKKLAPIVVFVYNRLEHTRSLLESLEKNQLASESELFIFADAYTRGTQKKKVDEVKTYIRKFVENNYFKKVTIIEAKHHQGLANSVIQGVSYVISKYKKVIVLEDDLCVSKDFLRYMNDGLGYYKNNKKIWSIAGFSEPYKILKKYEYDVYFSLRAESWGWATWENRWSSVDWKVKNYKWFRYNLLERYLFNRGGSFLSSLLDTQKAGKADSWAIRWCYAQFRHGAYTVHPTRTKVNNNGFDGSGTHCDKRKFLQDNLKENPCNFCDVIIDKRVLAEIREYDH